MSYLPRKDRPKPIPVYFLRPDRLFPLDAQSVSYTLSNGCAQVSHKPIRSRADLPDIDFSNVVIVRRRSLLSRLKAAYRAFRADADWMPDGSSLSRSGNIIPLRRPA